MYVHTNIIVRIITQIVDIHEKGIITHINVCIHKYKYSYNCLNTQISLENLFDNHDIFFIVKRVLKNANQIGICLAYTD